MNDHEEDESERGCARNLLDQDHDEDDDNEFDIYDVNDLSTSETNVIFLVLSKSETNYHVYGCN